MQLATGVISVEASATVQVGAASRITPRITPRIKPGVLAWITSLRRSIAILLIMGTIH